LVQAHPEAQKPSDFSGGFFVSSLPGHPKAPCIPVHLPKILIRNASSCPEKPEKASFFDEEIKKVGFYLEDIGIMSIFASQLRKTIANLLQ
jgi:hypothetical protein